MRSPGWLFGCMLVCLLFACQASGRELRAFWCDAWGKGFKTPAQTQELVDFAGKHGFTDVFVEVRKRCDAYYDSSIDPRGSDLISNGYDPLADILTGCHKKGIRVHAWIMAYDACTDTRLEEMDPSHICLRHPEWISLNDKGEQAYVGGRIYLDPGLQGVRDYITSVAVEIARKYPVDGLYVDGLRYPEGNFGYNARSLALFNAEYKRTGSPKPDDPDWCNWRRDQVTKLAKQMIVAVRKARPSIPISVSAYWNQKDVHDRFFQDWPGWMKSGYFDFAVPMVFVPKTVPEFVKQVDDELAVGNGKNIIIGQGTWRFPAETTNRQLRVIRGKGSPGFVLFDYVALSTPGKDGKCLADKLQLTR